MNESVRAKIFRFDPERDQKPRFQEYSVSADDGMTVLMLLDRIYREQDNTLSFRHYCCGLQMCRSCLMKINHKRKFACLTSVSPGEEVILEPLSFPDQHVKDLVVQTKE